jgi:hypothetical protein
MKGRDVGTKKAVISDRLLYILLFNKLDNCHIRLIAFAIAGFDYSCVAAGTFFELGRYFVKKEVNYLFVGESFQHESSC